MPKGLVNGVRLYREQTETAGPPVVLVHGAWVDHHSWDAVIPDLSRSFRVLAYDRRGHRQSERPAGQGSIREDVADLAALIEHLRLGPAHLVGNSSRGSIVLRLAGERPDLFRSLIVHEPPLLDLLVDDRRGHGVLAEWGRRRDAVVQLLKAGDNAGGARLWVETIALGPGGWERLPLPAQQTRIFNAPTFLDDIEDPEALTLNLMRLARFTHPALVTCGDQSAPFFPLVVTRVVQALKHGERSVFVGAGHVPHVSNPKAYAESVLTFATKAETTV